MPVSYTHLISTYTESFQYFVMQNYDKVKHVEEFAHLGGYTTTTFRRLFKNMYGVPVYEWILDKKMCIRDRTNTAKSTTPLSTGNTPPKAAHTRLP